jgi:hypothetical protein
VLSVTDESDGADRHGSNLWMSDPVTTGTTLEWRFKDRGKVYGPMLVQSTLRFSVEGFGTVEIYDIGYSTGSVLEDRAMTGQYHRLILMAWYDF